jgi:hypothetical protein
MGLLMRCGSWQVSQPISRPIPTGQDEATSHGVLEFKNSSGKTNPTTVLIFVAKMR